MITFSGAWLFKNKEHKQQVLEATVNSARMTRAQSRYDFTPPISGSDRKDGFVMQTGTSRDNKPSSEVDNGFFSPPDDYSDIVDISTLDQAIKHDLADRDILEGRDYTHHPKQHLSDLSIRLRHFLFPKPELYEVREVIKKDQ